ncbi:MAG: ADP-ribosylglycohydrolase family protein [Thermodesulfobacteriota bacterium]
MRDKMRGGDTDTNAAICGALLGSVYGEGAVPEQWKKCLKNCRPSHDNPKAENPRPECYWPCDAVELAEKLLGV